MRIQRRGDGGKAGREEELRRKGRGKGYEKRKRKVEGKRKRKM